MTVMKCIFCKQNSDDSKSIEHIIPESLGNKSHVLKNGIVCDKCNNYFATKIEKEVLEQPYFKNLRHRNLIFTKKNKLPSQKAFLIHEKKQSDIEITKSQSNVLEVNVENKDFFQLLYEGKINKLYVPIITLPENQNIYISRFIGKIALEALAERVKQVDNWNEDFVNHEGLDELRDYVRFGKGRFWPYKIRKIYEEDSNIKVNEEDSENLIQTIHEYDFLYIENKYLHFICIIMGIEYVINIGDRPLFKYDEWLKSNNDKSPLCQEVQNRKPRNVNLT